MRRQGRFFRAVYKDYRSEPLPSRSASGRFHGPATPGSTTYLASDPETAWKEVVHRWHADPAAYCLVEAKVKLRRVVDVTDPPTQARYDIDEAALISGRYEPCQRLAARLRQERVEGIWTYSAADRPKGRCLVVFLDLLGPGSAVEVKRIGPVRQAKTIGRRSRGEPHGKREKTTPGN